MEYKTIIERTASIENINQCAEIYSEAYNCEPWNDNWTCETATALLTCYYNTPKFMGWIARRDDVVMGCAIGNVEPYYSGDIFILKEIFVDVKSQGSGVGSSMLAAIKEDLRQINVKKVILFTRRPIFDFYIK